MEKKENKNKDYILTKSGKINKKYLTKEEKAVLKDLEEKQKKVNQILYTDPIKFI